jgi:endonuclease III
MKNASKHAETLKSLCRRLNKEHKPEPRQVVPPVQAIVRAILSFDVPDAKADDAMKAIERQFVDFNELRVATELEVQDIVGVRYPQIIRRAGLLTQILNAIFEKEHTLNLDRVQTLNKRDARTMLRELASMTPYVEGYVVLYGFGGTAFPVDDTILNFLKNEEVIEPEATIEEAQKFCEAHLKADECPEFFAACRIAAFEEARAARKKKS